MKTFVKEILNKICPKFILHVRAYRALIRNSDSFLYSTGWLHSLQQRKPVDKKGNSIPWMNYSIIKVLDNRLNGDLNLFEFGSGYSTYFYAKKVKTVTSVEYDEDWFNLIKSGIPDNVDLIYKGKDVDGDYCRAIKVTGELYDVVVIDGRDRVNCIKQSILSLSPKGVLLLDDSQREAYKGGIEYAMKLGFRALDFEGLKATSTTMERTTILYRDNNCLGI